MLYDINKTELCKQVIYGNVNDLNLIRDILMFP